MTTPELEELERVLRDDAPRPSPQFEARMEERVAQGFPRRRRLPRPSLPRVARLPRTALAGVASAALALSVTVALVAGGADDPGDSPDALAPPAPAAGESAGSAAAQEPAPGDADPQSRALPPSGDIAPGQRDRQIERSAQLTLAAPADQLGRAAEEIIGVADRHDGFVLRSEVKTSEDGGGGSFELRIPQERLRAALSDLSAIGEVRSRSEQGQDVTPAVSAAEERLDEARADRRGLLRRLERADTDEESRAIRRRLRLVSAEIRSLSGELRRLRERVDYAAVTVALEEGGGEDSGSSGGGAADALDDALGTLEGALEMGIRALGVLLPLLLLGGAGLLAARLALRRRRNAALG